MFPTLFVILAVAVLYWIPVRRWMSRWGTTPSDLTRVMTGDSPILAVLGMRPDLGAPNMTLSCSAAVSPMSLEPDRVRLLSQLRQGC